VREELRKDPYLAAQVDRIVQQLRNPPRPVHKL
jgi:hypothetical protein